MATLTYQPVRNSYSVVATYPVIEEQLEGVALRKRLDYLFKCHYTEITWILTSQQDYTAFMGFFRTTCRNATESFLMPLLTDIGAMCTHRCKSMGMPKLNQVNGRTFSVSTTLEVKVNPTWTGHLQYEEPDLINVANLNPRFVGPLQVGDSIQIFNTEGFHPTGPTALNLDGTYEIDAVTGTNQISLVSPSVVNSGWTTLATLGAPGQYSVPISTIMRVPT